MRRLFRPRLTGIKKKLDRREAVRERKALSAAHLERSIEKELIERLKSKAYGDTPLNVNENVWRAILDRGGNGERPYEEFEEVPSNLERHEEMEEEFADQEFISDMSGDEDDGFSDMGDATVSPQFVKLFLPHWMRFRTRVPTRMKTQTRLHIQVYLSGNGKPCLRRHLKRRDHKKIIRVRGLCLLDLPLNS
jgi:hypothetical protein